MRKYLANAFCTIIMLFASASTFTLSAQDESDILPENAKALKDIPWAQLDSTRAGQQPSFFLLDALGVFPAEFSCSGFPLDQGQCSSCAGCAIAQAYSIYYAFLTKNIEKKARWQAFSGSYIYNQVKKPGDCRKGALVSDGLRLLTSRGICPVSTFQHSSYMCDQLPQKSHLRVASNYKIPGFEKLVTPDMKGHPSKVVLELKNALAYRNPVIACLQIPKSLAALPEGQCSWRSQGREITYWHAVVITGYDEQHFQILNSKGCRWGCKGMALIPHAQLAAMLEWAFIMTYQQY